MGVDSSISNEGLIASMDNDGPTYYFRGSVENNYLKIGEHMFRIVRINGDETVRVVLDEKLELKTPYNLNENESYDNYRKFVNNSKLFFRYKHNKKHFEILN